MAVFTNNTFKGRWPVPTAAVVIADSRGEAAILLEDMLRSIGLEQRVEPQEMDEMTSGVAILSDGDY